MDDIDNYNIDLLFYKWSSPHDLNYDMYYVSSDEHTPFMGICNILTDIQLKMIYSNVVNHLFYHDDHWIITIGDYNTWKKINFAGNTKNGIRNLNRIMEFFSEDKQILYNFNKYSDYYESFGGQESMENEFISLWNVSYILLKKRLETEMIDNKFKSQYVCDCNICYENIKIVKCNTCSFQMCRPCLCKISNKCPQCRQEFY